MIVDIQYMIYAAGYRTALRLTRALQRLRHARRSGASTLIPAARVRGYRFVGYVLHEIGESSGLFPKPTFEPGQRARWPFADLMHQLTRD